MSKYTKTLKKSIDTKTKNKVYTTKIKKSNNNTITNIKLLIENNKDLSKNYSSKYKIIIGKVFDINYSNINILIKINGCSKEYKNEKDSSKIKSFTTRIYGDYLCKKNEMKIEYMLERYVKPQGIPYLKDDIINIYKNINNSNPKKLCNKTCSMNFVIYSDVIKFDLFGLLFLVNLIELWNTKKQEEFINKYSKKYNQKLNKTHIYEITNIQSYFIEIKKKLIKEIRNKIDYLYKMDKKEFNINKKYDLYYKLLLFKLFHEIRSYNNNYINYDKNNCLNIRKDYEFIDIEFENINLLDNIKKIQNYINDIKQMYYEVLLQCSNELYPIMLEYKASLTLNN